MAIEYTERGAKILGTVSGFALPDSGLQTILQVGPVAGRLFRIEPALEAVSGAASVVLFATWATPRGTLAQYHWYNGGTVSGVAVQLALGLEAVVTSANPITVQGQVAPGASGQVYVGASIIRNR